MKEYMRKVLEDLIMIDSPTGYTVSASNYIMDAVKKMGHRCIKNQDNSIFVGLNKSDGTIDLILTAHFDTLGAMVSMINTDGRMKITPIGGLSANNIETENCTIYTHKKEKYSGTLQLKNASVHVNKDFDKTARDFDSIELVVDEPIACLDDVKKFGIQIGDYVAIEPRFRCLENGYIKSRFLDDKLSVAILLAVCRYVSTKDMPINVAVFFSASEEIGTGCAQLNKIDFKELISVDMGCVGEGLTCKETQVSICAKDSSGPYNYDLFNDLIDVAMENEIDYSVDVYPFYKSDASVAVKAGINAKHALIGPGIYASHGYERGHIDGAMETYRLLVGYIEKEMNNSSHNED